MKFEIKVEMISGLKDNWDGYGACVPSNTVIGNCKLFYNYLCNKKVYMNSEDVVPTPYGTVDFDVLTANGTMISFEIGEKAIGYFFDDASKGKSNDITDISFDKLDEIKELDEVLSK